MAKRTAKKAPRKRTPPKPGKWNGGPPLEGLSLRALQLWDALGPLIEDAGQFQPEDAYTLAMVCRAMARAEQAAAQVDRDGVTVPGKDGLKKHPAVQVENDADRKAADLLHKAGWSRLVRHKVIGGAKNEPTVPDGWAGG